MSSRHSIASLLLAPLRDVLQFLLPAYCCGCGRKLLGDERQLCVFCLSHLAIADNAMMADNATELVLAGRVHFVAAMSLLRFSRGASTRNIVHHIKYYGNEDLALRMGRMMGEAMVRSHRFDTVDILVPVPLHPRKQRQRGYNQSELLCRGIALAFPRPVLSGVVARRLFTQTQTRKNRMERLDNMTDAFCIADAERLRGLHILLVDDVITTGATTAACADVILNVPDTRISIASLALAATL